MRISLITTGETEISRRLPYCRNIELVGVFDFACEHNGNVDAVRRFMQLSAPDLAILYKVPFLLPEDVIYMPAMGMINIHPSLLPKYRGLNPWREILANGETESGITIHRVDKYADHGEILAKGSFHIELHNNLSELMTKAEQLSWELLQVTLSQLSTKQ
jgi:methionyl-tRNA formyltransferase